MAEAKETERQRGGQHRRGRVLPSPEKQRSCQDQRPSRVFEVAKASITRAANQRSTSQSSASGSSRPSSESDSDRCITFEFPGPTPDGEAQIMKVFSVTQKGHITNIASRSKSTFVVVFDDGQVASRVARGFGQQIQLGKVQVLVTWPTDLPHQRPGEKQRAGKEEASVSTTVAAAALKAPQVASSNTGQAVAHKRVGNSISQSAGEVSAHESAATKKPLGRGLGRGLSRRSDDSSAARVLPGQTTHPDTIDKAQTRVTLGHGRARVHSRNQTVPSAVPGVEVTTSKAVPSENRASLFLGGLSRDCTEDGLRHALMDFSVHIEDVSLKESKPLGKREGKVTAKFAYIKFRSREVAQQALEYWQKVEPLPYQDSRVYSAGPSDGTSATPVKSVAAATERSSGGDLTKRVVTATVDKGMSSASLKITTTATSATSTPPPKAMKKSQAVEAGTASSSVGKKKLAQQGNEGDVVGKSTTPVNVPRARVTASRKGGSQSGGEVTKTAATLAARKSTSGQSSVQKGNVQPAKQPSSLPPHNGNTGSAVAPKAQSAIVPMSRQRFEFAMGYFADLIHNFEKKFQLSITYQTGKAVVQCTNQPRLCQDMEQNFLMTSEKNIQLEEWEYMHFLSTPKDMEDALSVDATQCNGHLSSEKRHLVLVGHAAAVSVASRSLMDFRQCSVFLSPLQMDFLKRCTNVETVVADELGVELSGLQAGSQRLSLICSRVPIGGTVGATVKRAKDYIRSLLNKWTVEKVEVEPILAKTASRLLKLRKLPVLLAAISEATSSTTQSYVVAGAPTEHVLEAQRLLNDSPCLKPVQLPSPPFTANYLRQLLSQPRGLSLPGDLNPSCLGDVQIITKMPDAGTSQYVLQIRSYVSDDVDSVLDFFDKLKKSFREEVELEPIPSAPLLCLHYLAHLAESRDTAKKAIADIENQFDVSIKSSTSGAPCITLAGTEEGRESARQAIFSHESLLAGICDQYVSLPTLTMDMIGLLRKRFLDIVESKVNVACLTFQAKEEITSLLKIQTLPGSDSVIVAIFGKSLESVKQAQNWISSLNPAKEEIAVAKAQLSSLAEEVQDWDKFEARHVVQVSLDLEACRVGIMSLTTTDIGTARQSILQMLDSFAPATQTVELSFEESVFVQRKIIEGEKTLPCVASLQDTSSGKHCRMLKLTGQKKHMEAALSTVRNGLQTLRSVLVVVSFPSQLAHCLEATWTDILDVAAKKEGALCLQQEKKFTVSASTSTTQLDCRPVLHLPESFPKSQIDGVTCFLVVGTDRQDFTDILQSIRNAGSTVLSQYVVLDEEQRGLVQDHFDKDHGHQEGCAFMHLASKGIHVCAASKHDLADAKEVVAKWLEKQTTVPLSSVVRRLLRKRLAEFKLKAKEQFQCNVSWSDDQLVVSGAAPKVDITAELLFESLVEWEQDICTRSLSIGHWLVPALAEPTAEKLLKELEEMSNVVCPPCQGAITHYQQAVEAEIEAKVEANEIKLMPVPDSNTAHFVTPPSGLVWHMNGLDEQSVMVAGEKLSELFAVKLAELEVCIPGGPNSKLCNLVARVAAEHLVLITVRQSDAGYSTTSVPVARLSSSCHLNVKGIGGRPKRALQALQSSISS